MQKSKTVAILLALFLWGLGAHHFYLLNRKKGFLYLIFCWTYVPFFLWILDAITLLGWNKSFNLIPDKIEIPESIDYFTQKWREKKQKRSIIKQEVENSIKNWILSEEDEKRIGSLLEALHIDLDEFEKRSEFGLLQKAVLMRKVSQGVVPVCKLQWGPMINLEAGECIIYAFENVLYMELKNKTRYVGATSGARIRIAKGFSYYTSASKGERINTMEWKNTGPGNLFIPQKHLIFASPTQWCKVACQQIIAIQPYSDGLSIQRDIAKSTPECFKIPEQDFANTLIQNVSNYLN